ncbi:type III-B CRISPR module RAMP protein Cmr1 [Malikia spinosa]|jgi:CRISPR-associated protein Cmr1|uniref:type III-B CRISPR module RAMP protein Cmr1 n=1 Tax=Malikia spinosa TaxID=86180 RepID=UPI002FDA63F3
MRTISATFEVVTPMFLGGADQSPDGIRPSSVKGALRFWWRAWAWSALRAQHPDDLPALRALHAQEARLFGLAAKEADSGQGMFVMHVRDRTAAATEQALGTSFDNGILYLLGMGLGSFQGGNHCTRAAIPAQQGSRKSGFEVKLIFKPQAGEADVLAVSSALQLFGLLGALGSRARHGLGSVSMTAMQGQGIPNWQAPQSLPDYQRALKLLLPPVAGTTMPPLSAFSQHTRIDASLSDKDPMKLLARLGREQQAYRSYGKDGMVNGLQAERNFKDDHDLVLKATEGQDVKQVPERVVFGLPHNYFFSSTKGKADVNFKPESGEGRRASPLLLHIHRVGDQYLAIHTLLKARFLPERAKIEVKSRRSQRVDVREADIDWQVLHDYLDRYQDKNKSDIWERIHG